MNKSAGNLNFLKTYSSVFKSHCTTPKQFSSNPDQMITESELKSLELQAISLIDIDLPISKQLIERCLRLFDERRFPILENIYLHYLHCDVCTRCGQIELAISSGEKALKLISNSGNDLNTLGYEARSLQLLGLLYSNTAEHSKAVYMFQRLLNILEDYEVPSISYFLVKERMIESLIQSDKHSSARPHILELLANDRSYVRLFQFAKVLINNSEYTEAKIILNQAIVLRKDSSLDSYKGLTKLALCEIHLEEYTEALTHLQLCVEIIKSIGIEADQEVLWVYCSIGQIHFSQSNYAEALEVLKTSKLLAEALGIRDIEYGNTILLIGKIKLKQHDKQEALAYLNTARKTLEAVKKEAALEAILAILEVYLAEGNILKTWEILQDIEANNYSPYSCAMAENEMGNLLREFGYASHAMRYYESSLQKYKILKGESSLECGKLHLNIGSLLSQQGKYPKAYSHLTASKDIKSAIFGEFNKEMTSVYEELSKCLNGMGKKCYARDLIEKARRIQRANNV